MTEQIPLVLIPGLSATARFWHYQKERLSFKRNLYIPEIHIHLTTIQDMAEAILEECPTYFALGGCSMGGYISFEIMRLAPERILGLALVDTSARADSPEMVSNRIAILEKINANGLKQVIKDQFPLVFRHLHRTVPEQAEITVKMACNLGQEIYRQHQYAVINRRDNIKLLKSIRCPVAVICGDEDQLTPPFLSQEMADNIPDAVLTIIRHAGHCSPLEQPEAVTTALLAWLERL